MKNTIIVLIVLAVGVAVGYGLVAQPPVGSIVTGQEYNATSTIQNGLKTDQLIRGGWGSLAQVTVTGAGDLEYRLVDATSTDALTGGFINVDAKTLAYIPAALAAGTYVFDVTYTSGLVIDVIAGTNGTSTILYR